MEVSLNSDFTGQRSKHERGQGLVEYALLLVLVAVMSIFTLGILGGFGQVEYNVLYGTITCSPAYGSSAGNAIVLIYDGTNCYAQDRNNLTWTRMGGFDFDSGSATNLGAP